MESIEASLVASLGMTARGNGTAARYASGDSEGLLQDLRDSRRQLHPLAFCDDTKRQACDRYFFFLPVPFSEDDLGLSEVLDDSDDFESDGFDSPDFSLPFAAAPSPELSLEELSGFFPA